MPHNTPTTAPLPGREAEPVTPLYEAFAELQAAQDTTNDLIGTLERRLKPALGVAPPEAKPDGTGQMAQCQFHEDALGLVDRARALNKRLSDLLCRIAI